MFHKNLLEMFSPPNWTARRADHRAAADAARARWRAAAKKEQTACEHLAGSGAPADDEGGHEAKCGDSYFASLFVEHLVSILTLTDQKTSKYDSTV